MSDSYNRLMDTLLEDQRERIEGLLGIQKTHYCTHDDAVCEDCLGKSTTDRRRPPKRPPAARYSPTRHYSGNGWWNVVEADEDEWR